MNWTAMSIRLVLAAGVLLGCSQSREATSIRIRVTEEVRVDGALRDRRDAVFRLASNVTNGADVHLVTRKNEAYLNLQALRMEPTNLWFRKWEYGRDPAHAIGRSPFYMIERGSIGSELLSAEHRLGIGDGAGLRHLARLHPSSGDKGQITVWLIIKAAND